MHLRTALLLSLLPLAGAAAPPGDGDALVVVTAHWRDRAQLQQIGARFQHMIIDDKAHTARAEASREDYLALRRAGIPVEIDDAATQRLRAAEAGLHAAFAARQRGTTPTVQAQASEPLVVTSQESIPNYACYRTVEETYATMDGLVSTYPSLARVVDIGPSWLASRNSGGYRMRALQLTNSRTDGALPNKPTMVVFASIHAREYTPAELLTRFGEWLANGYGHDAQATWLLDNFKFDLVLQANPDGRKKAESGLSWRKNVDNLNGTCSTNDYGIDLNRNFNFRWNSVSGGSSSNACDATYHGPSSMSEAETKNLLRYVAGSPDSSTGVYSGGALPDRRNDDTVSAAPNNYQGMFLDLHSYSQRVLWPWSFSGTAPPNAAPLRTLGRRLAWFNGYHPQQWFNMYAADGTDTDAVYGRTGAPSYTLEMGVSFFEDCNTFETSTYPKNIAAIRYAARNLWAPYVYPSGPDTASLSVSPGFVVPGNMVTVTATVDDSTFNQSAGTEPVQAIASVRAYIDHTPWSGAPPTSMAAGDGRFDTSREVATLRINTSRYAPGRHVVYVQGVDAANQVGTPQAVYFTVAKVQAMEAQAQSTPPAPAPAPAPSSAPVRTSGLRDGLPLRAGLRQN